MNDTDILIPQKVPIESTNSYYTLGAIYNGEEKYSHVFNYNDWSWYGGLPSS